MAGPNPGWPRPCISPPPTTVARSDSGHAPIGGQRAMGGNEADGPAQSPRLWPDQTLAGPGRVYRPPRPPSQGAIPDTLRSEASAQWVEMKLMDLLKAPGYGRTKPWLAQAVYIAPPDHRRKERFRTRSDRRPARNGWK